MTHSTFAERFAYARTLRQIATGEWPSKAAIGRAVDRTGQAVGAWDTLEGAPTDYRVHAPLAEFLGVPERWLIHGDGEPPRPALWASWLAELRSPVLRDAMKKAHRRGKPVDPSDVPTRRPKRSPVSPPVDRKKGA